MTEISELNFLIFSLFFFNKNHDETLRGIPFHSDKEDDVLVFSIYDLFKGRSIAAFVSLRFYRFILV